MRRNHFTEEQAIAILNEVEAGANTKEALSAPRRRRQRFQTKEILLSDGPKPGERSLLIKFAVKEFGVYTLRFRNYPFPKHRQHRAIKIIFLSDKVFGRVKRQFAA